MPLYDTRYGVGWGAFPTRRFGSDQLRSESVAVALGVEAVGAVARMNIIHEVAGHASRGRLAGDLPVTERLDLRPNVADGGAEVTDTESCLRLVGGETLAAGKVVHDTTLLGESVARHYADS